MSILDDPYLWGTLYLVAMLGGAVWLVFRGK